MLARLVLGFLALTLSPQMRLPLRVHPPARILRPRSHCRDCRATR